MPGYVFRNLPAFIYTVLFSFLIVSCNPDKPKSDITVKDGYIYDLSKKKRYTGTVKGMVFEKTVEYQVLNGVKQGTYKIFFENGKLEMSGMMMDNKYDGKWTYFYPNGQVESEGIFKNDSAEDKWVWFYPDGSLKESGIFKNGKRIGDWVMYNEKGDIIDQAFYIDGERRKEKKIYE